MRKMKSSWIPVGALLFLIGGYFFVDSLLFDGVRPREIKNQNFQANYFTQEGMDGRTAVVLLGGGQWGDYWGQYFAKNDMVGLSIPYAGQEGLPTLPEEIDLEYFEGALSWLGRQPEVNPQKVVVMGASKNARATSFIIIAC